LGITQIFILLFLWISHPARAGVDKLLESAPDASDIEDRRWDATQSPEPILIRVGKLAEKNRAPFKCSALVKSREFAAKAGKLLGDPPIKTILQMDADFKQEDLALVNSIKKKIPKSVNACVGAVELQKKEMKDLLAHAQKHKTELSAHTRPVEYAFHIFKGIAEKENSPTLVDKINRCPETVEAYKRAVKGYELQYDKLNEKLKDQETSYKKSLAELEAIHCG
jgi:hypothetical protein